jgi:hypothetical protein
MKTETMNAMMNRARRFGEAFALQRLAGPDRQSRSRTNSDFVPTQERLDQCLVEFRELVELAASEKGAPLLALPGAFQAAQIVRDYLLRGEMAGICAGPQDRLVTLIREVRRTWPRELFGDARASLFWIIEHLDLPSYDEFVAGIHESEANEGRTASYFEALDRFSAYLDDSTHPPPDLAEYLERHGEVIRRFRSRGIASLSTDDHGDITNLFIRLLDTANNKEHRTMPAAGTTLHRMAPGFFPLCDGQLGDALDGLGLVWDGSQPSSQLFLGLAPVYLGCCWRAKRFAEHVHRYQPTSDWAPRRSTLVSITLYNYWRFQPEETGKRWLG